ncbi:MAG: D-alanyl-D-alanine carboxypeptidase/D-alanyl-D-alanine-endopeptidase [Myxococcales bacterium]|nr:D-alanyl-D-alanine carboxypeptidase/D-alanyl-D-alanine-endopeptidase [Myxococcales bacterium]MCB9643259.1 D-alanyl-D-alanine carboxypeptidase/D-alanyl-D-alanine-endopeptidase [Myxococcales bacterium]
MVSRITRQQTGRRSQWVFFSCFALMMCVGGWDSYAQGSPRPGLQQFLPKTPPPKKASLQALQQQLKALLQERGLRGSKSGVLVTDIQGKVIFAHNAKKLFIPASNTKIFTMMSALKHLGPSYFYETLVYGDSPIDAKGVLKGNLYIKGSGDPSLRSEELWRIAQNLSNLGLRRVTGRLIFDDSFFDRERFGKGWKDHNHHRYRPYVAGIGALSLNYNTLTVILRPGQKVGFKAIIDVDPKSPYIKRIVNQVTTVAADGPTKVKIKLKARGSRDEIHVVGTIPLGHDAFSLWRRVSYPGWYTAHTFGELLRRVKVRIGWWPRRGKVPSKAIELYKHTSPSLSILLQTIGKYSSNFTAEQVLKTLGATHKEAPGTWSKGLSLVAEDLQALGISKGSYTMQNGSGLGRGNRFSPTHITTVLRSQLQDIALWAEYFVAQPIAGRDGTLRNRMKKTPAAGHLRAKTGTLDGVSALSGYLFTQDRRLWIFSICMNGKVKHNKVFRKVQNKIGALLAGFQG